jgi:rod shape determining protein RodA
VSLGRSLGLSGSGTVGVGRVRRFVARFDWPLFVVVALITSVGLLNLYSATYRTAHSVKFDQQLIRVTVGMLAFLVMTVLDYRTLLRLAWIILGCAIVLVLAVFILGKTSKGATRWLLLGGFRIQPSELAKIAIILAIARLFHESDTGASRIELYPKMAAIGLPVLLIAAQPDLGTAVLTALIVLSVGLLLMEHIWPLAVGALTGVAMVPILWDSMHDYQKNRILCFVDPYDDPTGTCWHTLQSIFAVGSGRLSGKGFMESTQNRLSFLPEHWTDFPFSVYAEEWGFVGSVVLLLMFGFAIFWCINVALGARDKAGAAICLGVAAMLFWHVVVNISMVLGMAPVVGVTLPLISYGGSSILTFFIAFGLVSSVSARRHGF